MNSEAPFVEAFVEALIGVLAFGLLTHMTITQHDWDVGFHSKYSISSNSCT